MIFSSSLRHVTLTFTTSYLLTFVLHDDGVDVTIVIRTLLDSNGTKLPLKEIALNDMIINLKPRIKLMVNKFNNHQ